MYNFTDGSICGTSPGDGVCVCPGLGSRVDTEREEAAGDQAHSNQSPLHTQLRLSWPPVSGTMRQHTEVRRTLDTEVRSIVLQKAPSEGS